MKNSCLRPSENVACTVGLYNDINQNPGPDI